MTAGGHTATAVLAARVERLEAENAMLRARLDRHRPGAGVAGQG